MEELDKKIEDVCGADKKCQERWLEVQTDCV